jgi:hypothetical protein
MLSAVAALAPTTELAHTESVCGYEPTRLFGARHVTGNVA